MSVDLITLDNGILFEGSGRSTLDGLITETIKQNDMMEDHKQYGQLMDYTDTTLLNPDQKFSSRTPNGGLKNVSETGIKAQRDFTFGPKKGISQREIGEKFTMSYLMSQWARTATNLEGAPDAIQAELVERAEQARDLVQGYDITYAEEQVKLYTLGFAITTSEGPGSACARDGLALFSAVHELKDGSTFSNLITGDAYADVATGTAKLQAAIDASKVITFDNGKKVESPKEAYKFYCSRSKSVFWKQVLNDGSEFSGQGTNANEMNQFNFKGNLVKLIVLDLIGDLDTDGVKIGTEEQTFLSNPTYIKKARAIRKANLYAPRVKNFENDETDVMSTSIRAIIGTGHFEAEFGVVGMTNVA
jgi:hypothetical protein